MIPEDCVDRADVCLDSRWRGNVPEGLGTGKRNWPSGEERSSDDLRIKARGLLDSVKDKGEAVSHLNRVARATVPVNWVSG